MSGEAIPQLLAKLIASVEQASAELVEAREREAAAIRESTTRLNTLNTAQKRLDEALAEIKKSAPRQSEWHRQQNPVQGFAAR